MDLYSTASLIKVAPPPGFKPTSAPSRGKDVAVVKESAAVVKEVPPKHEQALPSSGAAGKQKNKFVPLMSAEGRSRTTVLLPGRHTCQCLGQKHALVNNCVECGRIVCSQVCIRRVGYQCVALSQ